MSQAIVTELEWDDVPTDPESRGWWYRLMGEPSADLLPLALCDDPEAGHDEIVEALHKVIRADHITIEIGAVPDDD